MNRYTKRERVQQASNSIFQKSELQIYHTQKLNQKKLQYILVRKTY